MKVLLCQPAAKDNAAWLAHLRGGMPGLQFDEWQPGLPPVYDAAVVWSPPRQLIDEQPQLRALLNLGAGVDKLMALPLPASMTVVRLEDAGMAVQMAEYVCHALIRFFREFDAYERQQREARWRPRRPHVRSEFPVGVMGLGALGARVAQAVQQFDFPVLGWSRTPRDLPGVRCFHGDDGLPDFLQGTRVLVSLLPLTPATRGLLNRQTLEQIQLAGYVINVARGGLLVEDDLRALLDEGHLAGATLDVMQEEPLPPEHWLWTQPHVTLTPHISAQTLRPEAVAQVVRALQALARGEMPSGVVQRDRGY
ncbi:glyoxylate/hydroxypyruvate reductase A [Ottowia sp. GY511]|uniref:2-hydroxyacid dehydrogenase n=1 Tax=Ottowia flava TaxID=2675430 RepID=A0ABW4KQW2_9BURK|nr:glyoxylate/hydroxypyruvate reductase A [Ottowia sp. GY511]TXK30890.1 glyoxylate/hydroxypyruvate reductase A [Ottowia sp. GY511]